MFSKIPVLKKIVKFRGKHSQRIPVFIEYTSLQSFTEFLVLTLVSFQVVHCRKGLFFSFQELFASISAVFILVGGWSLGNPPMGIGHSPAVS